MEQRSIHVQLLRDLFIPVERRHHVSPVKIHNTVFHVYVLCILLLHPDSESQVVPAHVEIERQSVVGSEAVGKPCIGVPEPVMAAVMLSVLLFRMIQDHECRYGHCIKPAASETEVERGLSLHYRALQLEPAVDKTYGEASMILVEVSFLGTHIDYGRQSAAITCREAALIEVHSLDHISVEGGEQACKMAGLIHRDAVHKVQVVIAVSSVDMEPREEFAAARDSGEHLKGLYQVRRAHEVESSLEFLSVQPCQTGLGRVFLSAYKCRDAGFVDSVVLFLYEDSVVLGLLL